MNSTRWRPDAAVLAAMLAAGAVSVQFVVGKTVQKALYADNLQVDSTLPILTIAAAVVSVLAVILSSRLLRSMSPSRFVPLLFASSAALLLVEWALAARMPKVIAVLFYLHMSGLGPMFGSGFWLIAGERFDPRTAKQRFGQIAGAGTLGGLAGSTLALFTVTSVVALIPGLAALSLFTAWQIRRLAAPDAPPPSSDAEVSPDLMIEAPQSGLRVLAQAPYLRNLAALVLLGAMSTGLLDYVFQVRVAGTFAGQERLHFWLVYHAVVSVASFGIQTLLTQRALATFGLTGATSAPSIAVVAGGLGGVLVPGLSLTTLARGSESILHGSLFRSAYELVYTPIPSREKRAAKSVIDVGFDRLGEATSGLTILLVQLVVAAPGGEAILVLAAGCAGLAIVCARRVNAGYIQALERSLLNRAVELNLSDVEDMTTRTVMLRTIHRSRGETDSTERGRSTTVQPSTQTSKPMGADPEIDEIVTLKSRDRTAILRVLQNDQGLPPSLVPHTIPLLAWDPVAEAAVLALRRVAEERVGELIDALIDPNQSFAVRRRLARVFSVCVSQRAVDGLLLGLDDLRFEVRYQCGRSLAAIVEKNPRVRLDKERVYEVVGREVAVGRPVWESRRLLDRLDDGSEERSLDDFLKDRASQSLAHVFTLLSLVLPADPLRIAFRGLHTDDQTLRGTALEYLEGVLPPVIRERLWPFLEAPQKGQKPPRAREEILADLLRSNQSIMLNLEDLKRRAR